MMGSLASSDAGQVSPCFRGVEDSTRFGPVTRVRRAETSAAPFPEQL